MKDEIPHHQVQCYNRHWQMETTTPAKYKLHNHTLAKVTSAKYLGVAITKALKWDSHINDICTKANRTLRFLQRNLNIGSYFTLIRAPVEYASRVWDPHTQRNIQKRNGLHAMPPTDIETGQGSVTCSKV